ncbi:hypothetical protein RB596_004215 [Gaeumannomyces avenae]
MSSNTTSTPPDTSTSAPAPGTTSTTPSSPATSTPSTTSPPTSPSSSTPTTSTPPPATTPTLPPTSNTTPTTPTSPPPQSSSNPPALTTETTVTTPPGGGQPSTVFTTKTQPNTQPTLPTTSSTGLPGSSPNNNPNGDGSSSSQNATVIAIATVVPIVVVAILVLGGLFFWRKRKQRKAAEEERRKEVEEYGFNPNADGPTAPDVSTVGGGAYEDASSGYRGWGSTTLAGSTGRKASTTMSGGAAPVAYSDGTAASPTQGNVSDARSAEPLMHGRDGAVSPEGEILGAMGPSTSGNRGGDMRRGPSNASSSYSAAARSDGSGEGIGMAYGGDARYYDGYGSGPYADAYGAVPPRGGENGGASSPVIKDNPARRNTRIENSGHYPQQAGISQNF